MKKISFYITIIFTLFILISCNKTEKVKHRVEFNTSGGSLIATKEVESGSKVSRPNKDPLKENYIFNDWYKDKTTSELFDFDTVINQDTIIYAKWEQVDIIETFEVRIHGATINGKTQFYFKSNEEFSLGTPVHELGYEFEGWYLDEALTNKFTSPKFLNDDLDLYAKFNASDIKEQFDSGSYQESLWAIYSGKSPIVKVEYKQSLNSTWIKVDEELIRKNINSYKIDIVGITTGYYDIKITTEEEELLSEHIFVDELDRSGYAHFKYDEGIGAYNNDGTLKEDAIVVYVTDENKDSIIIPGIGQVGLGWILNNAQYSSNDKPSYDLDKYNQSLAKFDKPIVFRLIGTVTTPEGATIFNSLENGGSKGDNGHMVRMRDAKNITIEGIGEDATILGWGMHFMAASKGRGYGFEVRNITFDKYPEDAVGMEGVQSGSVLTNPVERGWIHNNTFLEGYCANPAESDKGAGDGSLDIKRGQYFTISYNQFLETKKTNLVGASDNNIQYHITYHHNYWRNVDSRVPLSRQANIHMYNNVFETTDDNQGQNSYVQNTRANAFIFSEANYFNASKAPSRVDSGAIKSFGDVKYSTYDRDEAIVVKNRQDKVTSGNKFENFDTDSNVFYYDSVNKRSNVKRLTNAVTARLEVYAFSGVNNKSAKTDEELLKVSNVQNTLINESQEFGNTKINKGNPFLVFEITKQATIEMTSTNKVPAVLVDIYGRRYITGSGTVNVEPGIYVIESSISHGASKGVSQAKDSGFENLKIIIDDSTDDEKISYVNDLIDLIPSSIMYSKVHYNFINDAITAFNQLDKNLQSKINISKALNALSNYNNLGKEHIESLINNIGTVTTESGLKISMARSAYNEATTEIKQLISNYGILLAAEVVFEDFEVDYINNEIDKLFNLIDISNLTLDDIREYLIDYNEVYELYLGLDSSKQGNVINIDKVNRGIKLLEDCELAYELNSLITKFDLQNDTYDNLHLIKDIYDKYQNLNVQAQDFITESNKMKLDIMYEMYLEYKDNTKEQLYYFGVSNDYFNVTGKSENLGSQSINVDGVEIDKGLKLESATKFTFKAETNVKLLIQMTTGSVDGLKINGDTYTDSTGNFFINVDLKAGEHEISRNGSKGVIIYLKVIEESI